MFQWLRRGAIGCVAGLAVLAVPATAFAYGPGGANNGFGLALSVSVGIGGDSVTVSAATGPCVPGGSAPISLVRAIANQTPTTLGSTTVNSAGGLDTDTVVIPVGTPVGVYIMFATCSGGGGATEVFTASFVVDGPIVAGTTAFYAPASAVSLSPHWATAATRAAVQPALDAAVAQASGGTLLASSSAGSGGRGAVAGSSGGAGGSSAGSSGSGASNAAGASGTRLAVAAPGLSATSLRHSQSGRSSQLITWVIVAAAVVALASTGLVVLRRRRPAGN